MQGRLREAEAGRGLRRLSGGPASAPGAPVQVFFAPTGCPPDQQGRFGILGNQDCPAASVKLAQNSGGEEEEEGFPTVRNLGASHASSCDLNSGWPP